MKKLKSFKLVIATFVLLCISFAAEARGIIFQPMAISPGSDVHAKKFNFSYSVVVRDSKTGRFWAQKNLREDRGILYSDNLYKHVQSFPEASITQQWPQIPEGTELYFFIDVSEATRLGWNYEPASYTLIPVSTLLACPEGQSCMAQTARRHYDAESVGFQFHVKP